MTASMAALQGTCNRAVRRLAALALLLVAGCGGEPSTPASLVPADSAFYVSVDSDTRMPGAGDPLGIVLSSTGVEAADVRSWLGDRAAIFGGLDDGLGLVLQTRDDSAAKAFARRVRDRYPHSRIVDGNLVVTMTRPLLDAATASRGFDAPEGDLVAVIDNGSALSLAKSEGVPRDALTAVAGLLRPGGTTTLRMEVEFPAVELEISGLRVSTGSPPSLRDVPSAAWLAFAFGDTRTIASLLAAFPARLRAAERATGLDLDRDVLAHLGAGWLYVSGTHVSEIDGRLRVRAEDEQALRRAATTFARRMGSEAELDTGRPGAVELGWWRRGYSGGLYSGFDAVLERGRVSFDLGVETSAAAGRLRDTPRWQDATRRLGGEPTLLLDVPTAERTGVLSAKAEYFAAREMGGGVLRIVVLLDR
jgi:hypothetical protein